PLGGDDDLRPREPFAELAPLTLELGHALGERIALLALPTTPPGRRAQDPRVSLRTPLRDQRRIKPFSTEKSLKLATLGAGIRLREHREFVLGRETPALPRRLQGLSAPRSPDSSLHVDATSSASYVSNAQWWWWYLGLEA